MYTKFLFLTLFGIFAVSGLLLALVMHMQTLNPGFNENTIAWLSRGCWIIVPLLFALALPAAFMRARYWRSQTPAVKRRLIALVVCSFLYVLFTNTSNSIVLIARNLNGGVIREEKDGSYVLQSHGTVLRKLNEQEYLLYAARDYRSLTAALLMAYCIFGAAWFISCWGKPAEIRQE